MIYRASQYRKEIIPKLLEYKDDEIFLVVRTFQGMNTIRALINISKDESIKNSDIRVLSIDKLMEGEIDTMGFDYIVGNPPYGDGNNLYIDITENH